jgi:hypothetical protein
MTLKSCELGDEKNLVVLQYLAEQLCQNESVHELDLSDNNFGPATPTPTLIATPAIQPHSHPHS